MMDAEKKVDELMHQIYNDFNGSKLSPSDAMLKAKAALKEIVMGCVPEAKQVRYVSGSKKVSHSGELLEMHENISYDEAEASFNRCRTQTIQNINSVFE